MVSRSLTVPTLLVAAVAVPYVATHATQWKEQWIAASQPASAQPATAPKWPAATGARPGMTPWPTTGQTPAAAAATGFVPGPAMEQTPLEGTPTYSLAEVLRLDVTKEWVYQRWARKSTALSELDLYGVRVPLVTGTKLHDLAGSLTFFFAPDGRVQRISFRGRTGDTTQLVELASQRLRHDMANAHRRGRAALGTPPGRRRAKPIAHAGGTRAMGQHAQREFYS